MEKIILASASPRRKQILEDAGIPFDVIVSDADEHCGFSSPSKYTMELSSRKLAAVYEKTDGSRIVLAADTVVAVSGKILGKPRDEEDAYRMLSMLSDGWHEVYTGIAMRRGGMTVVDCDVTAVRMKRMSEAEIRAYIATGEPLDKAGAYAIQERGGVFVEKLNGSYHNVVGLPIALVVSHLSEDFGVNVFL